MSSVSASAKGVSFLIIVQVASRAMTFLINQALLRYITPDVLGASFQYELYSMSMIYFARESLRVAIQRYNGDLQGAINFAAVPALLGIPLAVGLGLLYTYTGLPPSADAYNTLWIYGLASVIELLSEPCFALVQQRMAYSVRAVAETAGVLARCIVCLGLVLWNHSKSQASGTLPFAWAQMAYASVLLVVYIVQARPLARQSGSTLKPRVLPSQVNTQHIWRLFPRPLCVLALHLYLQNAVKYILTQGDAIIIASLVSLSGQGAYALASNYGGLVARMIFQPIEESSRNLFSKQCSNDSSTGKPNQKGVHEAVTVLSVVLKAYLMLALIAWSVGPSIAPQLLSLIAGARWSITGAGTVLAAFCYYIPLLAVNGITEAFVAAVATNSELKRQSIVMTFGSVAFAAAAFVFLSVLDLGAVGLVWANCLNMLARILWNWSFIQTFLRRNGQSLAISEFQPRALSLGMTGIAAGVVLQTTIPNSFAFPPQYGGRLVNDLSICALLLSALLVAERDFFLQTYNKIASSRTNKDRIDTN